MAESEEFEELLKNVYPERVNKNVLKDRLIKHGISESKIAKSNFPIHKLYFQHLAALPKRTHRKNRRGLLYIRNHKKPCVLNHTRNVEMDTKSGLNNDTLHYKPVLSEMEKLEARSQKFKMEKQKMAQTNNKIHSNSLEVKKIKLYSTIPASANTIKNSPLQQNRKTDIKEMLTPKKRLKRPSFGTTEFNKKIPKSM